MAGDPKAIENAGKKPNGDVPGKGGPVTPEAVTYHKDLDSPRVQSKNGIISKGK